MDRSLRSSEGFTLLELVIGLGLGAVVLLTASNFLVNFVKYSSNVIKSEAVLTEATLAAFEDIVDKISYANKAVVGSETAMDVPSTARPSGCLTDGSCIQVRVDKVQPTTPLSYSDDTVYSYWKSGSNLYQAVGGAPAGPPIASGINSLSFTRVDGLNSIRVQLGVGVSSGVTGGTLKEAMDTTVVMRQKSLN
jgi:Tfp pilus assembly protein PilE